MTFTCDCGVDLWVELTWNGLSYVPIFQHHGQTITHCPQCGEALAPLWHERPADRRTKPARWP